jgi:cation transport ATPase-like protein
VKKPFANRWLNAAVAWELGLLALVLYVPTLEGAFGTYPLPLVDWVIVFAAVTIVPVLDAIKWLDGVAGSAPSQLFLRIARNTPRSLPALEVSPQVIDVVPQLAFET